MHINALWLNQFMLNPYPADFFDLDLATLTRNVSEEAPHRVIFLVPQRIKNAADADKYLIATLGDFVTDPFEMIDNLPWEEPSGLKKSDTFLGFFHSSIENSSFNIVRYEYGDVSLYWEQELNTFMSEVFPDLAHRLAQIPITKGAKGATDLNEGSPRD